MLQHSKPAAPSFEQLFAGAVGVSLDDESAVTVAAVLASDPEPEEMANPTAGEFYRDLWIRYALQYDQWLDARSTLAADETCFIRGGLRTTTSAFDTVSRYERGNILGDKANAIRESLVTIAEKVFAPEGVSFSIDRSDISSRFHFDEDKPELFDPVAIWKHLESKYGGDFGIRLAWQQVAVAFTRHFGLERRDAVVEKRGYVLLDIRVSIDSIDKKYLDKINLCYSSRQHINHVCNCVSEIARWADRPRLASDILQFGNDQWRGDGKIVSRARFGFGEKEEVVVVTYQNRCEFRFRKDFADQIMLFLGEYAR